MSYDIIVEEVPKFKKRVGDQVMQGSNNTIIIFGTDRAADGPADISKGLGTVKDSGKGKGTGTLHFIVGRKGAEPDLKDDLSYLYLTMKSKIDDNLNLSSIEAADNDLPGAIMKSDLIRHVYRKNIKITSDDAKNSVYMDKTLMRIKIDGTKSTFKKDEIEFGNDTSDWMALANRVETELKKLHDWQKSMKSTFDGHTHITTATIAIAGPATIAPPTSPASDPKDVGGVKSELVKSK